MNRDHMMGFPPAAIPAAGAEHVSAWALKPGTSWREVEDIVGCESRHDEYIDPFPFGMPKRVRDQHEALMGEFNEACPKPPPPASRFCAMGADLPGIDKHNREHGYGKPADAALQSAVTRMFERSSQIAQNVARHNALLQGFLAQAGVEMERQSPQRSLREEVEHAYVEAQKREQAERDQEQRIVAGLGQCIGAIDPNGLPWWARTGAACGPIAAQRLNEAKACQDRLDARDKHFSGYEILAVRPEDVVQAAEYQWRQDPVQVFIPNDAPLQGR